MADSSIVDKGTMNRNDKFSTLQKYDDLSGFHDGVNICGMQVYKPKIHFNAVKFTAPVGHIVQGTSDCFFVM